MCLLFKCNSCLLSTRWDVSVPPKIQNRIRVVIDYFDVSKSTFILVPKFFKYTYFLLYVTLWLYLIMKIGSALSLVTKVDFFLLWST